ncbi:unnamed protein product [marine sediment metagenome]|uniref:Uncharacterized protein n=1 Tax=marine sediment metagenome TaxID=412755 RepID=X1AEK8_9ZZZZ
MVNAESLGNLIGQQFKQTKSETETQGLNPGTSSSLFVFADYRIRINVTKILVESRDVTGAMIWGKDSWGSPETWGGSKDPYSTVEEILLTQTIPTIARQEIAKWLASESAASPTHMALGTGSTAYSETNTALETEIARKVITTDISTSKQVEYILEILSTDTSFHGSAFREVGAFNNSVGGTLFSRGIISSLTMNNNKQPMLQLLSQKPQHHLFPAPNFHHNL